MKHDDPMSQLLEWMKVLEIQPTGHEGLMVRHVDWLIEANSRVNLTAITGFDEALRLHVLDSLTALPEVSGAPDGRMLDMGTGGGFPGIPLGLAACRETVLLDSVGKKVRAIEEFLRAEGLDQFSIAPMRAEEYAHQHASSCAVVVCRAVAPLAALVELATPLLVRGGRFVALKAGLSDLEYRQGISAAEIVGLESTNRRFLSLPGGGESREILTFTRVRDSAVALPRRNGMAQKKPLVR